MTTSSIRRQMKNIVNNYSEAEIKVREATSNDPWGPSSSLMTEIADLTYNVVAFSEIMSMVWKRLNDHGKNWRHVATGVGSNQITFGRGSSQPNLSTSYSEQEYGKTGGSPASYHGSTSPRVSSELEQARPQTSGEEELQLQLALAMSREVAEQEERLRRGDDLRLQMALEESRRDTVKAPKKKEVKACCKSGQSHNLMRYPFGEQKQSKGLVPAIKPSSARKTPESFLGPNAALVNLDSLVTKPAPSAQSLNPFLAPGAATPAPVNPFQVNQPQPLTLNQLRGSPVLGSSASFGSGPGVEPVAPVTSVAPHSALGASGSSLTPLGPTAMNMAIQRMSLLPTALIMKPLATAMPSVIAQLLHVLGHHIEEEGDKSLRANAGHWRHEVRIRVCLPLGSGIEGYDRHFRNY
ncbi:hypothetical protein A6R68_06682 [Neotoma lepida]|uniref:ENTH domain-containing protein n=1 Tax=Neotoma lepida TaxID=56216 RepID=A0A1A6GET8_NEOLE|nr:hypothetical protein A6R68_06682 [Neotoma lepida]